MNNLYLIQPVDRYGPNLFLPLAVSYQWMYAQIDPVIQDNWQVADVLIYKHHIDQYVHSMADPSVIALSCYVWNWQYNLTLAHKAKQKFPDCKIIIGGPSVDKRDHSFFQQYPWIDVAVTGEGEIAFHRLLQAHTAGLDLSDFSDPELPNTYSRCAAQKQFQLPERMIDLDQIPSPILSGFYDQILDMYTDRTDADVKWQVTYETLRGCPYKCAFCDIGDSYWNKIKKFSMDRVFAEIDWMSHRQIEYVSVCDSNWGMLDRDCEITQYVIDKKQHTGYPRFWDVTWAKSNSKRIYQIAKMEHDAGTQLFKGVTFAMQSFNSETLIATDRFNLDEAEANHYLNLYQQEGISTYSELIWPMPNETYQTLKSGIQQLVDLGQKDFLMVHPLVLTPNASMGQPEYKKQWQLQTRTVPLDTFYLKVEDPDNYVIEYTQAVCATNSADYQQVMQGFLYSHLFITMYYYGWAFVILEYIKQQYQIDHTDVVEQMLEYFKHRPGLINQEITATEQALTAVFEQADYWGRSGLCSENIFWEYKSATSVVFDQRRQQLGQELCDFLEDCYGIRNAELLDLNQAMCYDYRKIYPQCMSVNDVHLQQLLGLSTHSAVVDHAPHSFENQEEFHKVAYHYQRKNRFWKCSVRNLQQIDSQSDSLRISHTAASSE